MKLNLLRPFLLLLLVGLSLEGQGAVFHCPGPDGHPLFQDRPCGPGTQPAQSAKPAPTAPTLHHFFWRVESPEGNAWLLGSIHFGTPDLYPLAPAIEAAFDASTALVVEADVLSADSRLLLAELARDGTYLDGTTLSDHVSPELWAKLERYAQRHNIPKELLALQRPWLATFTLMGLSLRAAGYNEEYGVDRHFLKLARDRKPILELESIDKQMGLLRDLSPAEQEEMLRQTLEEGNDQATYFHEMIDAWRRGDESILKQVMGESFSDDDAGKQLQERLFGARNRAMSERIATLMSEGGTYFVVVGAGHLIGDGSVVALLRQRGYRVTRH